MSQVCFIENFGIQGSLEDIYRITQEVCASLDIQIITLDKVKAIIGKTEEKIDLGETHILIPSHEKTQKTKEHSIIIKEGLAHDLISKIKIRTYLLVGDEIMLEYSLKNALSSYFENDFVINYIIEMILKGTDNINDISNILYIEDEKEYPVLQIDNFKKLIKSLKENRKFDIGKIKKILEEIKEEKEKARKLIKNLNSQSKTIKGFLLS